jgi:hypothetical protein
LQAVKASIKAAFGRAAQGKVVREQGAEKAGAMAARVGSTLGATKPPKAKSAA